MGQTRKKRGGGDYNSRRLEAAKASILSKIKPREAQSQVASEARDLIASQYEYKRLMNERRKYLVAIKNANYKIKEIDAMKAKLEVEALIQVATPWLEQSRKEGPYRNEEYYE